MTQPRRAVIQSEVRWVGIEAHKDTLSLAVLEGGAPKAIEWKITHNEATVKRLVRRLTSEGGEVRACWDPPGRPARTCNIMSASTSQALFLTSVLVPKPTAAAARVPAEVRAHISALHRTVAAELLREALLIGAEPEAELAPELASPWATAL